jgi:predicted O-linked N-acetylglucosamine transferase (SPINDLY family)
MLDPFPYHGTTMTCEALWMGVPVVTMAGADARLARRRESAEQRRPRGIGSADARGIRRDRDVALARDVPRLVSMRVRMRQRMSSSPLLDGAGFARDFEATLRSLLQ